MVLAGCSTTPFPELFPLQYGELDRQAYQTNAVADYLRSRGVIPGNIIKGIPEDIVSTLPTDFALAYEAGYLVTVLDSGGGLGRVHWGHRRVVKSAAFKRTVAVIASLDYERFDPPGYPNVVCFRPKGNAMDLLDEGWFADWVSFIAGWDEGQFELQSITQANQTLVSDALTASQAVAAAVAEISRLDTAIQATTEKANAAEARLKELRAVHIQMSMASLSIGAPLSSSASVGIRTAKPTPPFDPKLKYKDLKKDDFFEPVLKDNLTDSSKKDWSNHAAHETAFEYLDPDVAAAMDKMHDDLKKPDGLPAEVQKALKSASHNGKPFQLRANSSTRTPMGQAYVSSGSNPKGSYIGSDHLFGQAVDIAQPHAWGSEGFKAVQKVVGHFGFKFSVTKDKPHITLSTPTRGMAVRRLAIARGYVAAAQKAATAQAGAKSDRIFEQSKLVEKKAQLVKDLQGKQGEIAKRQDLFSRVYGRYAQFQREIQAEEERIREQERQRAERQRQKEEAERAANENRGRGSSPRDPGDIRDRIPREPRQADVPKSEPKASEPKAAEPKGPSRDTTPRDRSGPKDRTPRDRSGPKEPTISLGRMG